MSPGGQQWAQPRMGAGDGAALHLPFFSPPRAGPGLSILLSGAPGPSPSTPGSDPGGSWLGLVQKKDYPDQSLVISAPAHTLPVLTGALSAPHRS